jgi:hypothetical protein
MTTLESLFDSLLGGILPYARLPERDVHVFDGTTYRIGLTWLRRRFQFEYHTPHLPRKVRKQREAARRRDQETVRRHYAGESLVQVGDQIPRWGVGMLATVGECRDSENTVWKRAVGEERYAREDNGDVDRSQQYEWIAWSAGEWGGGWRTDEGMLDYAPIQVLKLVADAPA